jgi:hypothetical protein
MVHGVMEMLLCTNGGAWAAGEVTGMYVSVRVLCVTPADGVDELIGYSGLGTPN